MKGAPRPHLSTPGSPNLRLAHGSVRCLCVSVRAHQIPRLRVCVCARVCVCVWGGEFTKSLGCVCACACVLLRSDPEPAGGRRRSMDAPMGLPPNSTPRVLARTTTTATRVRVHLVGQSALDWCVIKVYPPPTPAHPPARPSQVKRRCVLSTDETLDDRDDHPTSARTLRGRRR